MSSHDGRTNLGRILTVDDEAVVEGATFHFELGRPTVALGPRPAFANSRCNSEQVTVPFDAAAC
jgi:hypothetical protein